MIVTEITVPPRSAMPVRALAEHLKLGSGFEDDGAEDELLETYLRAAMACVEARVGIALLERQFSWSVTRWRDAHSQRIPVRPVTAIRAVRVIDAGGNASTLEANGFEIEHADSYPLLTNRDGRPLPRIPRYGQFEMEFVGGYSADWTAVPADLRQAVFLLASYYYENRAQETSISGTVPFGVMVLLESYRNLRLGAAQ